MDGSRDDHSEWSQPGRYDGVHLYAESKYRDTDKVIYKREAVSDVENKFTVTTGERVGGKLGGWD